MAATFFIPNDLRFKFMLNFLWKSICDGSNLWKELYFSVLLLDCGWWGRKCCRRNGETVKKDRGSLLVDDLLGLERILCPYTSRRVLENLEKGLCLPSAHSLAFFLTYGLSSTQEQLFVWNALKSENKWNTLNMKWKVEEKMIKRRWLETVIVWRLKSWLPILAPLL